MDTVTFNLFEGPPVCSKALWKLMWALPGWGDKSGTNEGNVTERLGALQHSPVSQKRSNLIRGLHFTICLWAACKERRRRKTRARLSHWTGKTNEYLIEGKWRLLYWKVKTPDLEGSLEEEFRYGYLKLIKLIPIYKKESTPSKPNLLPLNF